MNSRIIFVVFAAIVSAPATWAQTTPDTEEGKKPYGVYSSGDIDSVSMTSGNLLLNIPVLSYPQRGHQLDFRFSLYYSNKGWTPVNVSTNDIPDYYWQDYGFSGVTLGMDGLQQVQVQPFQVSCPEEDGQNKGSCGNLRMSLPSVLSPDGSQHQVAAFGTSLTNDSNGETADGTGFLWIKSTNTVIDRDGVASINASAISGTFEDTEGDEIVQSSTGWTDTVGRVLPATAITNPNTYTTRTPPNFYLLQPPSILRPGSSTTNLTGCPSGTQVAYLWNVPAVGGGTEPYKFCYETISYQSNFGSTANSHDSGGTSQVLTGLILPNSTSWVFTYDSWGEIASLTYPTGGSITYTWTNFTNPCAISFSGSRAVASRTINANDGTPAKTWNYAWNNSTGFVETAPADSLGVRNDTVHKLDSNCFDQKVQTFSGPYTNNAVLKTVVNQYNENTNPFAGLAGSGGAINGVLLSSTITWPTGQSAKSTTAYDAGYTSTIESLSDQALGESGTQSYNVLYGAPVLTQKYDYGATTPTRQVATNYVWQTNSSYLNANLLTLPSSVVTEDGGGNRLAESDYTYDESAYLTTSGYTLQASPPNGTVRGHNTTLTKWLNTGTSPVSHTNYYDTGDIYQSVDPLSHTMTYTYGSAYSGSLPTKVTNALGQSATYVYDSNTGHMTSFTDANNQTTTFTYSDSLGRLTDVLYPNVYPGTSTHGEAKYTYNDTASPVNVVATDVVSPSVSVITEYAVDGIGREILTALKSDPQGTTYTQKNYDGPGRLSQEWNATRCALPASTSCSSEPTWGITTHVYDALDREVKTIPPDGSSSTNNVTTSYSGNEVTVTDQAGTVRSTWTDALGRLTQVSEGTAAWITDYTYDGVNNLLCIEQHGGVSSTGCSSPASDDATSQWRVRRFTYDSLSRLLTAKNPETGTITYGYNADSVATSKIDNRGMGTTYTPDVLHRMTTKTYSDSEPTTTYTYDANGAGNYGIGRRTGMTDASGSTTWTYDPMGKPLNETRTIGSISKQISMQYNVDGSDEQITYPSGAVISITPGGAGRPLAVTDTTNLINYAKSLQYAPHGALASAIYGYRSGFAGMTEADTYNSRLQPLLLSAASPSATIMSLGYSFGLGTNDNGNVLQVQNNKSSARSQTFTYDAVNRLATARTATTWGEAPALDAWGNLYAANPVSGTSLNPQSLSTTATGANQLAAFTYDGAGNLIEDGTSGACSGNAYIYNAEEQISCADGVTYTYNGDGERVKKSNGTLYWGAGLAESTSSGTLTSEYIFTGARRIARRDFSTGSVYYFFSDHLGSSNVVTDNAGTIQNESDFYPFGGESQITDLLTNQKYKFTGKERDTESGNDYFGARYMSSSLGRFLSPDWSAKAEPVPYAKLDRPQTLNLYAYAGDNPVTTADMDGHKPWIPWSRESVGSCILCPYEDPGDQYLANLARDQITAAAETIKVLASLGISTAQQQTATPASTTPAQGTDYVSVSYWPKGAGGFGHIGIGVDSDNTVGYSTADPKVPWYKRIFGAPAGGTENDIKAHTSSGGEVAPHGYIHIPISADQAAAMRGAINARDPVLGNGGHYNLIFNNCAQFVEGVLHAGGVSGVPHSEVFGPAILGGILWAEH